MFISDREKEKEKLIFSGTIQAMTHSLDIMASEMENH